MNERYWTEQIAKKDARINELEEQRVEAVKEGNYYKGLYLGIRESMEVDFILDDETKAFIEKIGDEPKKKSKKK